MSYDNEQFIPSRHSGGMSGLSEQVVETLAKALLTKHPDGYSSPLQSDYARRLVAEMLLASDWLREREVEAGQQALRDAARVYAAIGLRYDGRCQCLREDDHRPCYCDAEEFLIDRADRFGGTQQEGQP